MNPLSKRMATLDHRALWPVVDVSALIVMSNRSSGKLSPPSDAAWGESKGYREPSGKSMGGAARLVEASAGLLGPAAVVGFAVHCDGDTPGR